MRDKLANLEVYIQLLLYLGCSIYNTDTKWMANVCHAFDESKISIWPCHTIINVSQLCHIRMNVKAQIIILSAYINK